MSRRDWYLATNTVVLGWIVAAAVIVGAHRAVAQPVWLMIHLPLLGAATAAILVWSQHFADTLLRRPSPWGRPGLAARLALHTGGAIAIAVGIETSALLLIAVGASAVASAIALHVTLLTVQLHRALPARFAPLVRYYVAAGLVFLAGIGLGALLALAPPETADGIVLAHLLLNVYGWLGLTVLGTLVLLWPTVLHARVPQTADAAARRALPVLVAGILLAAASAVSGPLWGVAAGLAVWLVGVALLVREAWREARAMPPGTFAGWSLAAAAGWIVLGAIMLAVIALSCPDAAAARTAVMGVLGPIVAGFAVQVLCGALSYLLPVVTVGSPAAARRAAEVLDRGAVFRVVAFNGAALLSLAPLPSIARVLLSVVALGVVLAFLVLVVTAVVAGRRVRRVEGAASGLGSAPAAGRAVPIGLPGGTPAPRPRRAGAVAAALAVVAACVVAGIAADPAAMGISVATGTEVAPTGETTTVEVTVAGMRFVPATIEVPAGDQLVVRFRNTGQDVHDLTFANGVRSQRLAPGASETLEVGVVGADLEGWCSIVGHRQQGMVLDVLAVGAPPAAAGGAAQGGHGSTHAQHGGAAEGEDAASLVDLQRPLTKGFGPWPAALAPAPDETVHRVTLRATESVAEVAPGVRQERWTLGGTTPGPVLRGRVGDVFEITLINDGTIGHSIDFHAGPLAPDEPMRTIAPGESLVYRFTASRAGIWMYHCSTMPMSVHLANGMFGAVIIDPPDLAPADREYLLVQSEVYLGAQDGPADADKIVADSPDLVVFNGHATQYAQRPLPARVGERVRVWVLDAGPNDPTSFHVVGGQFDAVWAEGAYTLTSDQPGGAQALGLFPAQGGFVELVLPEAGTYPFVSHRMVDAERGARGLFHVE